jgi:hypothetical protein
MWINKFNQLSLAVGTGNVEKGLLTSKRQFARTFDARVWKNKFFPHPPSVPKILPKYLKYI